jgi:peptidoglycan/LPS O-acetylase OafA/YrhL
MLQAVFPAIFTGQYPTLYFIGLLLVFYLFFLLLRSSLGDTKKLLFKSCILFAAIIAISFIKMFGSRLLDIKVHLYFPLFIGGMLLSMHEEAIRKIIRKHFFVLSIFALILNYLLLRAYDSLGMRDISSLLLIGPLTGITLLLNYYILFSFDIYDKLPSIMKSIVNIIAFASYSIYLFHRPIWEIMVRVIKLDGLANWFYITIAGTLIIITTCYYVQKAYNSFEDRLKRFD